MLSYFRSPFPSTKGFSAYRTPGIAVHGPIIVSFAMAGFLLSWPHPMLRPFLIIWMLAGLYLGRDLAILSHYNPLLTLFSWAAFAGVLYKSTAITNLGVSHAGISCALSAAVGALLLFVAFVMTRSETRGS